jgi:hypothetical protein
LPPPPPPPTPTCSHMNVWNADTQQLKIEVERDY